VSFVLAFDLETVPDTNAGRRLQGLTGNDAEVASAMLARRLEETDGKRDFLKPAFHRVIGLGAVAIQIDPSIEVSIKTCAGESERDLLAAFLDWIRKRPQLVSWNGGGFDLPVIRYRSLLHGLSAASLYGPENQRQWDAYAYRYGEAHVDLMDVLSGYGASPNLGLDEMARLMGLPGKTIATGDQVVGLAFAGDWSCIEAYVGSDAIQTALLFLRWELSRGRIAPTAYVAVLAALQDKLADDSALDEAIEAWRLAAGGTERSLALGLH
jgi:predicted PolB exonuclease-like 3'-5' exonuclease